MFVPPRVADEPRRGLNALVACLLHLRAQGQLGSAGLRHDEAVLDVVGGEAFESCLAAVGVDELAQERKGGAVDRESVGIRRNALISGNWMRR
jgi:hypothetical protein